MQKKTIQTLTNIMCKQCNDKNSMKYLWRKKNGIDTFTGIVSIPDGKQTVWTSMGLPNYYRQENGSYVLMNPMNSWT